MTLTALTRLRPDRSGAASIATFVVGTTRGSEGVGSNPAWCYSNGTLEARIRDALAKRLPAMSPP